MNKRGEQSRAEVPKQSLDTREQSEPDAPEKTAENAVSENPEESGPKNSVQKFYDKLPVTYKQVDIFVKIMIGVIAAVLIAGIMAAKG